ncbi:hypothetical protein CsatB_019248 [Cannabis sativa]
MTSGPHLPRRSPLTHNSLSLCASHPQSISLLGFFILGSQHHTFHLLFEVGNSSLSHTLPTVTKRSIQRDEYAEFVKSLVID